MLTPDGVVGRITRVAGHTSDIMLLVDPRSAIDVVVPRTGGRGILRGWVSLRERCPTCGLVFDRGESEDYWFGGYTINWVVSETIAARGENANVASVARTMIERLVMP